MFPIAAAAAQAQGIGLLPISYMIMIAASTAFSTPIGFQTNLMVYGPGGYKYTDFLRLGLPLQVLVGVSTVTIVSLAWL
jgi:di/tricarboxylate transporter